MLSITMEILLLGVILSITESLRRVRNGQLGAGTRKAIMVGFYLYSVVWAVIFPLILQHNQYRFHDLNEAFTLISVGITTPTLTLFLSLKFALMFLSLPATKQDNLISACVVLTVVAFIFMIYTLHFSPRMAVWVSMLPFAVPVFWSLARTAREG